MPPSKTGARGFSVNKRNMIRHGIDELVNLDAVPAQPSAQDDAPQRPPDGTAQRGEAPARKATAPEFSRITTNANAAARPLPPAPPETHLARWSAVFRQLFSGHPAHITDALARVERWRRATASHGMLIRLRRVPPYIEATKALVEAMSSDRALERSKAAFWLGNEDSSPAGAAPVTSGTTGGDATMMAVAGDAGESESDSDDDDDADGEQHGAQAASWSATTSGGGAAAACVAQGPLTAATLPMIYASAVSRAVFEMTESSRKYSDTLDSSKSTFRSRAQAISLPEELTEARNQIAHGRMPTLAQLRFAASLGLQYLYECHWQVRAEFLAEYRRLEQQAANKAASWRQRRVRDGEEGDGCDGATNVNGGAGARRARSATADVRVGGGGGGGGGGAGREPSNAAAAVTAAAAVKPGALLSLAELRARVVGLLNPALGGKTESCPAP